ncbi:MAG TPA: molybdenum cofactor biosynthesis protein MoaE [Chitinophagaceae bacterium]|nr:molybdenum cofactor biosynthesis protein MoaE [Chitinophagaceae bacterium]
MIDLKILDTALSASEALAKMNHPACGGIDIFIGMVRAQTEKQEVVRLEYEAYYGMAIKEMEKIAQEVKAKWPVEDILIHHRVGILSVGEIAVIIAVNAPHRKAAFEACQYAIDTLKQTVPIWKKEVFVNGEEWVSAHA